MAPTMPVVRTVLIFVHLDSSAGEHVLDVAERRNTPLLDSFRLEFEIEHEVSVGFFRPDRFVVLGDEHAFFKDPVARLRVGVGKILGEQARPALGVGVGFGARSRARPQRRTTGRGRRRA